MIQIQRIARLDCGIVCGLLLLIFCCHPVFAAVVERRAGISDPAYDLFRDSWQDRVTGAIQEIRFESSPAAEREVSSLHFRPALIWNRLEMQTDFGFYYNPWLESWQWGIPDPVVRPVIANFIEEATYQGPNYSLRYGETTEVTHGYGLLLYDYQPAQPYRSICLTAQLGPETKLTLTEPAEIRYFSPFSPDLTASLETARLETGLKLLQLPWEFGFTGVREENGTLTAAAYPDQGWSMDFKLAVSDEIAPFIEIARLDNQGGAVLAGLTGKYAITNYLAGYFRTDGHFAANYFGGRYEDLKVNTLAGLDNGLPDVSTGQFQTRDGGLGGVWIDMPGMIRAGLFFLDDAQAGQRLLEVSLSGEVKPLNLKYGFFNYGADGSFSRYDWYVQGSVGIWDYGFHHYYRENASREVFRVSVRL